MRVEDAGERGRGNTLLKMMPIMITLAMTIMGVAMAADYAIIPPLSGVTLTGMVSDSFCGADHGIRAPGDPECARACVVLGAQYALMVGKLKVGKRMFILHGHEADLERFAGTEVRVKGRALGRDVIIVDQVNRSYSEGAAGSK
jgi:hypothetical protein